MTTLTRPAPTPRFQPLRHLARRWMPTRTIGRPTRPLRRRTLAHPPALPVELWDIDHTELRAALDHGWH